MSRPQTQPQASPMRTKKLTLYASVALVLTICTLVVRSKSRHATVPSPSVGTSETVLGSSQESESVRQPAVGVSRADRAVIEAVSVQVGVTDASTHKALPDARVECTSVGVEPASSSTYWTAADGTTLIPLEGRWRIRIERAGYSPDEREFQLDGSEISIQLEPAATLELTFRGPDGAPRSGVEVVLLPPLETGPPWDEFWRRDFDAEKLRSPHLGGALMGLAGRGPQERSTSTVATDEADPLGLPFGRTLHPVVRAAASSITWLARSNQRGEVIWETLPARDGYRWALVSKLQADVHPPHERQGVRVVGAAFQVAEDAPRGLSGTFDLKARVTTRFEISVERSTQVIGRVDMTSGAQVPARAALFDIERYETSNGERLVRHTEVQKVRCAADGSFAFDDVSRGPQLVRAFWRPADGELAFAAHGFEVNGEPLVDVGTISPSAGSTIEGRIEIRGPAGERFDLRQAFPVSSRLHAALSISTNPDFGNRAEAVNELVGVEVGQPFRLHGIPDGKVWLRVAAEPGWPEPAIEGFVVKEPDVLELQSPCAEPLELTFRAEYMVPRDLILRFPGGVRPSQVRLHVRSNASGETRQINLKPSRDADDVLRATLSLAAGGYDYLINSNVLPVGDGPGVFATGSLKMTTDAEPLSIDLEPAISVSGTVKRKDGTPATGEFVGWSPGEWAALFSDRVDWIYTMIVGEEGHFHLRGVPPGTLLVASRPELSIQTSGVQAAVPQELVWPD